MSCKSLLVMAVVLFLTGSVSAQPQTEPEQKTHIMTINNGDHVVQKTFIWENGSWHEDNCRVAATACLSSRFCNTYSPRPAEAACSFRVAGAHTPVPRHCP
jgi:hypothetical protein